MPATMKVVVLVGEGYPELYRELASIPARQRAARMRTLATMGCTGKVAPPAVAEQPEQQPTPAVTRQPGAGAGGGSTSTGSRLLQSLDNNFGDED